MVVDAPWFVRNSQLHRECNLEPIQDLNKISRNWLTGPVITITYDLGRHSHYHTIYPQPTHFLVLLKGDMADYGLFY
jgi:hypothetical protein